MSFEEDGGGGGGGSGYMSLSGVGGVPLISTNHIAGGGSGGGSGMMSSSSATPNTTAAGGSEEELNCTLWVGNLDGQITEEMVADTFIQCGPIAKIHIPKGKEGVGHKGYCFVQFLNEETVPYAMNFMDGVQLGGKTLRLQPRPGSKHRKILDQLQVEKQQYQQMQHHQQLLQPQQVQPQQWYVSATPQQMAQFQNVLFCPPQMFQPYGGIPNVNMNSSVIPAIQYSPGIGMPVMQFPLARPQQQQIPVQQQLASQVNPHHHQRGPRTEFRSSRPNTTRPQMNGFHSLQQHRPQINGSAQPSHFNNSSSAANPSTSTPSASSTPSSQQQSHQTVLNGSATRFPHTRGPRPQHHQQQQHRLHHQQTGPRTNGNNTNNNNITSPVNGNRLSFNSPRSVTTISTHLPHPQQHALQSPTTSYVQQQLIPTQLYQSPPQAPHYSFPTLTPTDQQQYYQPQHRRQVAVQLHPHHAQQQQTGGLVSFPVTNIYPPYQ